MRASPARAWAQLRRPLGPHAAALVVDALTLYTTGAHPKLSDDDG